MTKYLVLVVPEGAAVQSARVARDNFDSVEEAGNYAKDFTDEPVPGADSAFNCAYVIAYEEVYRPLTNDMTENNAATKS